MTRGKVARVAAWCVAAVLLGVMLGWLVGCTSDRARRDDIPDVVLTAGPIGGRS